MRTALIIATVVLAFFARPTFTQTIDDFDAWMITIDERIQRVQGKIAAKDADGVVADAKALESAFAQVEAFWVSRGNAADAVDLAKQARQRAAALATAAGERDFDRASGESVRVAETCTACHRLYRPLQ
jgi:hypothetical protein